MSTTAQQWIEALIALARAEGELTDHQAAAIGDFVETVTGEFSPLSVVIAYSAYKIFTKKPTKEEPPVQPDTRTAIDAILKRLDAIEVRLAGQPAPGPGPAPAPGPGPTPPPQPAPPAPVPPAGAYQDTPGMTWRQRFSGLAAPNATPLSGSPATWSAWRLRARIRFGSLADGRHVFLLLLPGQTGPWPLTWEFKPSTNVIVGAHPAEGDKATGNLALSGQTVEAEFNSSEAGGLVASITRADGGAVQITDATAQPAAGMSGGVLRFGATQKNVTKQGYVATDGEVVEALLEVR